MAGGPLDRYEEVTGNPVAVDSIAQWLFGPPLVGWAVHVFLFGIVCSNFCAYLSTKRFKTDACWIRGTVLTVVSLDAAVAAVHFSQLYIHGTSQHRDVRTLFLSEPIDCVSHALSGTIALLVQLFLARRASRLIISERSLRRWFLATLATLAFVTWLLSIFLSVLFGLVIAGIRILPSTPSSLDFTSVIASLMLWLSAAVDCAITLTLTMFARHHIQSLARSGFSLQTEGALRKLVTLGLQTAGYTTFVAIGGAVASAVYATQQDAITTANVFLAFSYPLPSLYSFSLLATLNGRDHVCDSGGLDTADGTDAIPAEKHIGSPRPAGLASPLALNFGFATEAEDSLQVQEMDEHQAKGTFGIVPSFAVQVQVA